MRTVALVGEALEFEAVSHAYTVLGQPGLRFVTFICEILTDGGGDFLIVLKGLRCGFGDRCAVE